MDAVEDPFEAQALLAPSEERDELPRRSRSFIWSVLATSTIGFLAGLAFLSCTDRASIGDGSAEWKYGFGFGGPAFSAFDVDAFLPWKSSGLLGADDAPHAAGAGPLLSFYMYRVQNDEDYSPENQDMANIAGALWYLHNEIVWHHWIRAGTYSSTPKTRIERFKVQTRATPALFAKGMNFGVVNAFDLGQCTGPYLCENLVYYGPAVGCETWTVKDNRSFGNNFPHQQWLNQNMYPNSVWYSLPGGCNSRKFWDVTASCLAAEPSGACPKGISSPTGERNCTYTYEKVGEISINALENISSFDNFVESGGVEYDRVTDKGTQMSFWDEALNVSACQMRIDRVKALFKQHYPTQEDLPDPVCDFSVEKFYPEWPNGTFPSTPPSTTGITTISTTSPTISSNVSTTSFSSGSATATNTLTSTSTSTTNRLRKVNEKGRLASFLVVGDWGYDKWSHGWDINGSYCQSLIADTMLKKMEELGDVEFIINVGDSFYPSGVTGKSDWAWNAKWRDMYNQKLRNVPWYSVYGNHDYHVDPCICSDDPNACAQVNYDINNREFFYMPGYNWIHEHADLGLEVVAMDTNQFMMGWNRSITKDEQTFEDCKYTACEDTCYNRTRDRTRDAFKLFNERSQNSSARNLLVFSHYPTDYFYSEPDFIAGLSDNSKHDIFYFGGHRHNTDNYTTMRTGPNVNWVVGGGGGWSCDGKQQGFVVGEIAPDARIQTYSVLVDYDTCCIDREELEEAAKLKKAALLKKL